MTVRDDRDVAISATTNETVSSVAVEAAGGQYAGIARIVVIELASGARKGG